MAGSRFRFVLPCAAAVLALSTAAGIATGQGVPERPGPPTAAEVEGLTRDFLSREPAPARAKASVAQAAGNGTGTGLFPKARVISLYGAPQLGGTVLGRKSVGGAGRKLKEQTRAYADVSAKTLVKAFDLVGVIATSDPGPHDMYRTRQPGSVIRRYLDKARAINARLVLDIQPGRSTFVDEVQALRKWIRRPDVDVALDPEWNVGVHQVPGEDVGDVGAKQINQVSAKLARMIERRGLPPKLLVVHQFRGKSVRHESRIRRRGDVDLTLNFDGIGDRPSKKAGYRTLSSPRLFNGFSLFYRLDTDLMTPRQVLRLDPTPNYVMYQ